MRRVAISLLALALAVTMVAGQADVAAPTQALVQPRPRAAAAPLPAAAPAAGASPALAPLAAALAGNASFSTFWTVIQAARLESKRRERGEWRCVCAGRAPARGPAVQHSDARGRVREHAR